MKTRMKINNRFNITALFSLVACEKGPFDCRTKYGGNYHFVIHRESGDPTNGHLDTSYSIDGRVDYDPAKHAISKSMHNGWPPGFILYEDDTIEGRNNVCTGEFNPSEKVCYSC